MGAFEQAQRANFDNYIKSVGADSDAGRSAIASHSDLLSSTGGGYGVGNPSTSSSNSFSNSSTSNNLSTGGTSTPSYNSGGGSSSNNNMNNSPSYSPTGSNINLNQYNYLKSKVAQGGGDGVWAQQQLDAGNYMTNPGSGGVNIRDALQNQGYQVGFDPNSGSITASRNGQTFNLGADQYTNVDGHGYLDQNTASKLFNQWNTASQAQAQSQQQNPLGQPQLQQPPYMNQQQIAQTVQQTMQPYLQNFLNPQVQNQQQLQDYAQRFAQAQAQQQQSSLQNMLNQYQQQYNTSVSTIDNSTAQAKQALEDKYFQNYLAARDSMADRGLAGSGLANDQNTRMLLAKQQDMAGIYQDAATRQADAQGQFNNEASNIYQQQQQINPSLTADSKYQELYQQAMQNQLQANSTAANFLGNTFGYMFPNQNAVAQANANMYDSQTKAQAGMYDSQLKAATDMFKWTNASADEKLKAQTAAQQLGFDMYKFNNLSADQKANISEKLYQWNNLSADQKATLQKDWAGLGITAQHNAAMEKIDWAKVAQSGQNEQDLNNYRQATIAQTAQKIQQTGNDMKAKDYLQQAGQINSQIAQLMTTARQQTQYGGQISPDTKAQLDALQSQFQNLQRQALPSDPANYSSDAQGWAWDMPSGSNFNGGSGGGDYNNYYKLSQENSSAVDSASSAISSALDKAGMPQSWLKPMLEIASRESDLDPTNQNGSSTAYGMFQFLNGTWDGTGVGKTSDPALQAEAAINYIKGRYGDPTKALQFWDAHKWY